MATRKKAKSKSKAKTKTKRKKTTVKKVAKRSKTGTVGKKRAKKAPVRRASPGKARPPRKPAAAKPTPSRPAPPTRAAPPGQRIGVVTHYYSHLSVAILRLETGTLRVGDMIHIRGHTTDFSQRVGSLEVDHAPVSEVGPNDDFGLKVTEHAREHDVVYKLRQ
jgi:hypothetical protein